MKEVILSQQIIERADRALSAVPRKRLIKALKSLNKSLTYLQQSGKIISANEYARIKNGIVGLEEIIRRRDEADIQVRKPSLVLIKGL
jgi:hypothetical protein